MQSDGIPTRMQSDGTLGITQIARLKLAVDSDQQIKYSTQAYRSQFYCHILKRTFGFNFYIDKVLRSLVQGKAARRMKQFRIANSIPDPLGVKADYSCNDEVFGEQMRSRYKSECSACVCVARYKEWDILFCADHTPARHLPYDVEPVLIARCSSITGDEDYMQVRVLKQHLGRPIARLDRKWRKATELLAEAQEVGMHNVWVDKTRREELSKRRASISRPRPARRSPVA